MERYKEAQELWLEDFQPPVETVIGFVEPYRDPYGARAEFEGLVGIRDTEETKLLNMLVENSDRFISSLPWVDASDPTHGKGPFELPQMGFREFSSIQSSSKISLIVKQIADVALL